MSGDWVEVFVDRQQRDIHAETASRSRSLDDDMGDVAAEPAQTRGTGSGGVLDVVYSFNDYLRDYQAKPRQKASAFNKELKKLRDAMAPGGKRAAVLEVCRDITREAWVFDMVCSCGKDVAGIIGDGIVKAYAIFFDKCYDHNMQQPRFDIMIVNVELWMTRMHPSKESFGHFVDGWNCLPAWGTVVLPELQQHLEATQVQRPVTYRRGDGTYSGLHQNDLVSNPAAADFLKEKAGEWYATEHPRPSFAMDLTDMTKFRWFNFLAEKRWCTVDKAEVEAFWMVWHENEPCFLLRMRSGECWVVQHCGSDRGPKLIQIQEQDVSFA